PNVAPGPLSALPTYSLKHPVFALQKAWWKKWIAKTSAAGVGATAPSSDTGTPGHAVGFAAVEPWPDPVDGETLLDELVTAFERFAVLPAGAAPILACWTVLAHSPAAFDLLPILLLVSPEPRCGKTKVLSVLHGLVDRPLASSNITMASVFRIVEAYRP